MSGAGDHFTMLDVSVGALEDLGSLQAGEVPFGGSHFDAVDELLDPLLVLGRLNCPQQGEKVEDEFSLQVLTCRLWTPTVCSRRDFESATRHPCHPTTPGATS